SVIAITDLNGPGRSFRCGRSGWPGSTAIWCDSCRWGPRTNRLVRRRRWGSSSVADRVHFHEHLIFSPGTQVVTLRAILGQGGQVLHSQGSVAVVVRSPRDLEHSYRVRFPDGSEHALRREDVVALAQYKEGRIGDTQINVARVDLFGRVIYRCIIGSRAYGLDDDQSDIDYRGIFLPPAHLQWSLYGVPDQIEHHDAQEQFWELQ